MNELYLLLCGVKAWCERNDATFESVGRGHVPGYALARFTAAVSFANGHRYTAHAPTVEQAIDELNRYAAHLDR